MNLFTNKLSQFLFAIIFSGLCFYLSFDFSGNYGFLFWIAPIPVLSLSFNRSAGKTFLIAFTAYLIGRLSWFFYLVSVATIVPAIIFIIILCLIFALIVLATRRVVIKANQWYSVFAFPVLFSAFEFLVVKFSTDGSAGSIAYSQSNILPVIQIVSVTGILGITFFMTLIPSAIATAWFFRKQVNKFYYVIVSSGIIIASTLTFGIMRLNGHSTKETVKAGLTVLDEKSHSVTQHPDVEKEKQSAENYARSMSQLADEGAKIVVLPERAINIDFETMPEVMNIFTTVAREKHIFITSGYTNFKTNVARNSALVIDPEGNLNLDYNKVHLVTGFENRFTPGKNIGLFTFNNIQAGTAICKDLDFPNYIKNYGAAGINFLTIPAWDFTKDDWLHSRMAILRGVENGFSEIRTARLGRLTISDAYGRVTAEANSSQGNAVSLLGDVSLQKINTVYNRRGDWFGILNIVAALLFIFLAVKKHSKVLNV